MQTENEVSKRPRNVTALFVALAFTVGAAGAAGITAFRRNKQRQRQGDDAPGYTARRNFRQYEVSGRTVTIARPREELYAFWRDFENLPKFMENVEKVRRTGPNDRAIWTIKAPGRTTVDVETEIVREEAGHFMAWRSLPGSDIDTEGRVAFEDAPGQRGTRVTALIAYKPPGGKLGKVIARMLQREPEVQARHDLKRFKMLMETGEIATSARRRDEAGDADSTRRHVQPEEA